MLTFSGQFGESISDFFAVERPYDEELLEAQPVNSPTSTLRIPAFSGLPL